MRGALMSARYDMEAAEPSVAQLRSGVKLMQVSLRDTVGVHGLAHSQSLSGVGLGPTVRVV